MSTPPQSWLFTRGHESVRIVREEQPNGGVRLSVYGRGKDFAIHEYADVTACMKRQATIEQALVGEGFQLLRGRSDRRVADEGMWQGYDHRGHDSAVTARKVRA